MYSKSLRLKLLDKTKLLHFTSIKKIKSLKMNQPQYVLQRETLASYVYYLSRLHTINVNKIKIKENGFK